MSSKVFYSHCRHVGYSFEAGRVTDHLVQGTDNVCKARSHVAIFLPTVQHQLVQGTGAVHGGWQAIILFNSIDHLGEKCKNIFMKIADCTRFAVKAVDFDDSFTIEYILDSIGGVPITVFLQILNALILRTDTNANIDTRRLILILHCCSSHFK